VCVSVHIEREEFLLLYSLSLLRCEGKCKVKERERERGDGRGWRRNFLCFVVSNLHFIQVEYDKTEEEIAFCVMVSCPCLVYINLQCEKARGGSFLCLEGNFSLQMCDHDCSDLMITDP
jgi:hypothetical protein